MTINGKRWSRYNWCCLLLFKSSVNCILFSFVIIIKLTQSCESLGIDYSSLKRNWTCCSSAIVQPVRMHGYPPVKSQCRAGFHTHEDDDVDHESQIEFMRFFNTTIDLTDAVDELKQVRKRKLKKVADKIPPTRKTLLKEKYHNAWNPS